MQCANRETHKILSMYSLHLNRWFATQFTRNASLCPIANYARGFSKRARWTFTSSETLENETVLIVVGLVGLRFDVNLIKEENNTVRSNQYHIHKYIYRRQQDGLNTPKPVAASQICTNSFMRWEYIGLVGLAGWLVAGRSYMSNKTEPLIQPSRLRISQCVFF